MAGDRPQYGLLVCALGAIVLAVSVFLPWYALSFTANGVAVVQRVGDQVASQFGNAALGGYMGALHADLGALAGRQFTALSAHQVLTHMNVLLLGLAGLAIVIALGALAGSGFSSSGSSAPERHRAPLALLGAVATVCVLYRMVDPPTPDGALLALSLREGAWLALFGSVAIAAGSLWPPRRATATVSEASVQRAWSGLSGWTPES